MRRAHATQRDLRQHRLRGLWAQAGPLVMGILNCSPDSFSGDGIGDDPPAAADHATRLLADGARIVDVGGESTRPGSTAVSADEELARVLPVLEELRRRHPELVLSVDTSKTEVAAACLAAGADIVNDVRAARAAGMLELVAEHGAAVVLMHMRGEPRTMQADTRYEHVVAEVHAFLLERARAAQAAGIPPELVWLDPGIGFGKDDEGNLSLLAAVPELAALGHPVLVGPSRKSFIGRLTGAVPERRLAGTLAALGPAVGVARAVVRVHDVAETVQYLTVARRLLGAAA